MTGTASCFTTRRFLPLLATFDLVVVVVNLLAFRFNFLASFEDFFVLFLTARVLVTFAAFGLVSFDFLPDDDDGDGDDFLGAGLDFVLRMVVFSATTFPLPALGCFLFSCFADNDALSLALSLGFCAALLVLTIKGYYVVGYGV